MLPFFCKTIDESASGDVRTMLKTELKLKDVQIKNKDTLIESLTKTVACLEKDLKIEKQISKLQKERFDKELTEKEIENQTFRITVDEQDKTIAKLQEKLQRFEAQGRKKCTHLDNVAVGSVALCPGCIA